MGRTGSKTVNIGILAWQDAQDGVTVSPEYETLKDFIEDAIKEKIKAEGLEAKIQQLRELQGR